MAPQDKDAPKDRLQALTETSRKLREELRAAMVSANHLTRGLANTRPAVAQERSRKPRARKKR